MRDWLNDPKRGPQWKGAEVMKIGKTYQEGKFKKKSAVIRGKKPPKNTWEIRVLGRPVLLSARKSYSWAEIEEEKKRLTPENKGHSTVEEILEKRMARKKREGKEENEEQTRKEPTIEEVLSVIEVPKDNAKKAIEQKSKRSDAKQIPTPMEVEHDRIWPSPTRAKEKQGDKQKTEKRKSKNESKKEGPSNSELQQAMIVMMGEMRGLQQNMKQQMNHLWEKVQENARGERDLFDNQERSRQAQLIC